MSNSFTISTQGRVATEPTLRYGDDARPRVYFRLAVDDMTRKNDGEWVKKQTVFHDVVAFGKSAERYAAALTVGDPIVVAGDLRFNTYTTKEGEQHTASQIVATAIGPDLRMCDVIIDRTRRDAGPDQTPTVDRPGANTPAPSTPTLGAPTDQAADTQVANKIKQPPDQQHQAHPEAEPASTSVATRGVATPRWPTRPNQPVTDGPTL